MPVLVVIIISCIGLALCFYCCRALCPAGPGSFFKDLNFDDDVQFTNIRQVELAVDERVTLLGVSGQVLVL